MVMFVGVAVVALVLVAAAGLVAVASELYAITHELRRIANIAEDIWKDKEP